MLLPVLSLTALLLLPTPTLALCPRSTLESLTRALITAQTTGDLRLLPLTPNTTYTENDAPLPLKQSILTKPLGIALHRSLLDTTTCTTSTELIAGPAQNTHPYILVTRLAATPNASTVPDFAVTDIQTVVADAGDWLFNATASLAWSRGEKWAPIPEEKRDSREVIKAAGDAYMDSWRNGSVRVPYGTPCARLEGGLYTGEKEPEANTCVMPEFPPEFSGATRRRYVIDEQAGAVDIFYNFPFLDTARPEGTASSNLLRVEGGKIRYIHEVTVCSVENCGR